MELLSSLSQAAEWRLQPAHTSTEQRMLAQVPLRLTLLTALTAPPALSSLQGAETAGQELNDCGILANVSFGSLVGRQQHIKLSS